MLKKMFTLEGKSAIVTGSSRGIGRAVALTLAEAGADVAINYNQSAEKANEVKKEIEGMGRKCVVVQADVSRFEDAQKLAGEALKEFGKVDILVNNAGINRDKTLRRMTPEEWEEVIRVNLNGIYYCTKAVIDSMIEKKGGVIVSLSSIIGEMGNIGQANYATTKAGIMGFTKSMAKELARNNIRVNAVAPGFIETDMLATVPDDIREGIKKQIPLGRFGTPEEIALSILYL